MRFERQIWRVDVKQQPFCSSHMLSLICWFTSWVESGIWVCNSHESSFTFSNSCPRWAFSSVMKDHNFSCEHSHRRVRGQRPWETWTHFVGSNLSLLSLDYKHLLLPIIYPTDSHLLHQMQRQRSYSMCHERGGCFFPCRKGEGQKNRERFPWPPPQAPLSPQFLLYTIARSWKLSSNLSYRKSSRLILFQFYSFFSNS